MVGEMVGSLAGASTESSQLLLRRCPRPRTMRRDWRRWSQQRRRKLPPNVQSVASATEELSSSINEISRQVQESARMASTAVDEADATNGRVEQFGKGSVPDR